MYVATIRLGTRQTRRGNRTQNIKVVKINVNNIHFKFVDATAAAPANDNHVVVSRRVHVAFY